MKLLNFLNKFKLVFLFASILSLAYVLVPINNSSYVGDDWPNSQTPDLIRWRFGEKNLINLWSEISFWNDSWFRGQGRIYSVQFIENRLIFYFFENPTIYKLFQYLINILAILIIGYLIYEMTKSINLVSGFLITFAAIFQIRPDFDPHLAFGGMLQSMMIKIILTIIFGIFYLKSSKNTKLLGFLVIFIWISAMFTYEYSWLCIPAVIFYLISYTLINFKQNQIIRTKLIKICLALILSTATIAFLVFGIFKPRAIGVSDVYRFRFAFPESLITYLKQTYAAIPGSVDHIMFSPVSFENLEITNRAYLIIFLLIILFFTIFIEIFNNKSNTSFNYRLISLLVFGFLLFISPGIIIAGQPVWWDNFVFGSSYLGVYVGEVGFSIFLFSLYLLLFILIKYFKTKKINANLKKNALLNIFIFIISIFFVFTSSIWFKEIVSQQFNNQAISDGSHARDESVDAWNLVLSQKNFFNDVSSLDNFISPSNEDAYERNAGDFFAKTGIRLGLSLRPVDVWDKSCLDDPDCLLPEPKALLQDIVDSRLKRKVYFPRDLLLKDSSDWIDYQSLNKSPLNQKSWYFNFVPIGAGVHLAILGNLLFDETYGTFLDSSSSKVMAVYAPYSNPDVPVQFQKLCLENNLIIKPEIQKFENWGVRVWNEPLDLRNKIDIRTLSWGYCESK